MAEISCIPSKFTGAWHFDGRRQRKTAAKLEDRGGLLVYIRYPDSLPGSLSGIWNMGVATFGEVGGMKCCQYHRRDC